MAKTGGLKKQTVLSVIGIILVLASASVSIMWEMVGREAYLYKSVLVVAKDIKKGDTITADCLKTLKMEADKLISNPITNANDIIGKAAKQFIAKNSQIAGDYFDNPGVVLKDDQFIFKVPVEWIGAVPSSIRREDAVAFYPTDRKYFTLKSSGTTQDSGDGADETQDLNTSPYNTYPSIKDDTWLDEFDAKNYLPQTDGKVQPPLFTTTVAYVKDSANREIVTVGEKERFDGSSQPASIEIVITLKELRSMELSLEQGKVFLILAQEN